MKPCSILIPTRQAFEAIELTVESIIKRTNYNPYKIVVCDNSGGKGNGNRLEYLKEQEKKGNIKLIENVIRVNPITKKKPYGHGENIRALLKQCDTPLAMLLCSGSEVVNPDWLVNTADMLKTDKDLGVAKFRGAENHFQACYSAPRWIPNWMLLNMELYRNFMRDDDFSLKRVPLAEYWHKDLLAGIEPPRNPDPRPLQVFLDTGWRLWERLKYENPDKYRMLDLPFNFCWKVIRWFGGLDRNAHRPDHEYVIKTRQQIRAKLHWLREGY